MMSFIFFKNIRFLFLLLAFFSISVKAVEIHFPDEELASESVLPLIDPPEMVLNRNIPLKFRTEFGVGVSFGLDEPFYFSFYPTGILVFHLTEVHAVSLTGTYFPSRLSLGGESLKQGEGLSEGQTFDPSKAPYPQMSTFLKYQYTPYYGKISLTKKGVMNLSIYGFLGLGLIISNDNDRFPAGSFGVGQKLYINKWLGVRGDLGFYGFYGPAVAKLKLDDSVGKLRYTQIQAQDRRWVMRIVANLGIIILI